MNCPVCNAEVSPQQSYCTQCGSPLSAAAPTPESTTTPPPTYSAPPAFTPPPPGYPPPPPGYAPPPPAGASGISDNAAAAIAYITIIPAIIFLIIEPYNRIPFVRFHSIQCIGLAVASIALHIAATIIAAFFHVVPFFGALMVLTLHGVVGLLIFIAWLICIIKASQGQWFKLPIIGDFAERQART